MPAYIRRTVADFLEISDSELLGALATENAKPRFQLAPEAIDSWNWQLPIIKSALAFLVERRRAAHTWNILLEYPIPQVGKRIDAVLLAHDVVILIELKSGVTPTGARRQVEDYGIALACFHEASAGRKIVPLAISNSQIATPTQRSAYEQLIEPAWSSRPNSFGSILLQICNQYVDLSANAVDPAAWDEARFRPVPSIIEAAVKLYAGMSVFEIGHAAAAREELTSTTDAILDIARRVRENDRKAICFVTGVPGAGKTLVGLNAVHHSQLKDVSMFLSGNGPLVKIIREALIRDVIQRERTTRRSAQNTLHTFVANVHTFAGDHAGNANEPSRNVIVFDEAQRAWDEEQNKRPSRSGRGSTRPSVSEPKMLLEIMGRRKDWSLIIALVGGGQEINRGEAGLSEWGRSLREYPDWEIYAAGPVLSGDIRVSGFELFCEADPFPERLHEHEGLHLAVNIRSIRGEATSNWVDAILSGKREIASQLALTLKERPVITRHLSTAKDWLTQHRIGLTRAGLVCSSAAIRLRADGLETAFDFHKFFEWEHWFLDRHTCEEVGCDHKYCGDVRSSSKLEVCATQFEVQGLELDWIGVCWGEDLVWKGNEWVSQRFNNKQWAPVDLTKLTSKTRLKGERKHQYRVNAYRVLLTRARQGMVIYVPNPSAADLSRSHVDLDHSYEFLVECGALPIED